MTLSLKDLCGIVCPIYSLFPDYLSLINFIVPYDEHPQRIKLAWSTDSLMLAVVSSKGDIYVIDNYGVLPLSAYTLLCLFPALF